MMKGLKKWRLFSLLAALTVFLAGCGQEELSTLLPAGQVGRDQFNLLLLSSAIMLLVIIVVMVIYVAAIVRFRRSKLGDDHMPKDVEGSHTLELVWTIIPILLVLLLLFRLFITHINMVMYQQWGQLMKTVTKRI